VVSVIQKGEIRQEGEGSDEEAACRTGALSRGKEKLLSPKGKKSVEGTSAEVERRSVFHGQRVLC